MLHSQLNGSKRRQRPGIGVSSQLRGGLRALLAAHREAREHGVDAWQFAVEIEELRRAGLTCTDLRALVLDGIVTHAREKTRGQGLRTFVDEGRLTFVAQSCFRLTSTGAALVANGVGYWEEVQVLPRQPEPGSRAPQWDTIRRTLMFAGALVRFRRSAPYQELILSSFQELRWPIRIDDPLPGGEPGRALVRLHNVVKKLNRKLCKTGLHFRCEQDGKGVICATPNPVTESSANL
jgi:hypothetical protein